MKASQLRRSSPDLQFMLVDPESVQWEMQQIQHQLACRAYELFEGRNREHGYDWEDWFRAESELLRPLSMAMLESGDRLSIRVNVLGFEESELKVSIEPLRLMIVGKKKTSQAESEGGKKTYIDGYPDRIMRVIPLAAEVAPEKTSMELRAGVLQFELLKAAGQAAEERRKAG